MTQTEQSEGADVPVADLIDELIGRVQAGESVDIEAAAARFPAHAGLIRRLVPAAEVLAALSGRSRPGDAAADSPGPGPEPLGDFRIVRELGRGGMGVVYEAEQLSLGRRVALKVLPFAATMDPRHLQRFKNEAKAAASLRHDHIVQVYGIGCDQGIHYYAMELIEGRTLAQVIDDARPTPDRPAGPDATLDDATTAPIAALSTEKSGQRGREFCRAAAALVADAADALEYAHGLGIVHRDVKPGNLLLDAAGRVYVGDFGVARVGPDAGLTMSGDLLGTLRYMSPEQARARHGLVDHRTDVYGLGATLYELLTGHPAVGGADRADILRAIAFEEPVAPRKLDRFIPAELETITCKALEKNPAERYQSARDLANDLRRWLADQTIRAKPPTVRQRATKWARRHKSLVRGAAAVLVVTVAAGAVGSVVVWRKGQETEAAYRQVKDERDRALKAEADATAQKWRAGEEAADTRAFATFLADHVLAATRPAGVQGGVGVNVTMAEALEKAEPRLAEVFAGRPKAEALARHELGVTWQNLGRYPEAERHLRRALELRREHLGPGDEATLRSMNGLAIVLSYTGRASDAVPLYAEVFERMKITLGPDNPDTLTVMHNLAANYHDTDRLDRAVPLFEEGLRLCTARDGPDDLHTLRAAVWLGRAYVSARRAKEAIPLLDQARDGLTRIRSPYHLEYFAALYALGDAYSRGSHAPQAIPLLERARDGMTRIVGPDHLYTLDAECKLGTSYVIAGRAAEAIPLLEEVRNKFTRTRGPDDQFTRQCTIELVKACSKVARAHLDAGRTADAVAVLERVRDRLLANDLEFPYTALAARYLGWAYRETGRFEEAIALHQNIRESSAAKYGPDDGTASSAVIDLDRVYETAGWFDRSIAIYEEALPRARAKFGDVGQSLLMAGRLGASYRDAGRADDGARVFDEWLPRARAQLSEPRELARRYLLPAAETYRKAGQLDRAVELEVEATALARKYTPPGHGVDAQLLAECGRVLLRSGKTAEAEPLLRAALGFQEKAGPGWDPAGRQWDTSATRALLGGILFGQRKYAEAEPLLLAGYAGLKEREKAIPPPDKGRLPQAANWLVELYAAVGKPDEAAKWRAERAKYDPEPAPPPREK